MTEYTDYDILYAKADARAQWLRAEWEKALDSGKTIDERRPLFQAMMEALELCDTLFPETAAGKLFVRIEEELTSDQF